MSPSGVEAIAPSAASLMLAAKIECAILSVLVHCHGQFEDTLQNWFSCLQRAFPDVDDSEVVREAFQRLWEEGIVGLNSPWIGDYGSDSTHGDFYFLALDQFTVSLTARGVVRWDAVRR